MISAAIILVGILLRIHQFLLNRALWLDEARLVLNIVHRSPLELLKPLNDLQVAPIGFLLVQKFFTLLFGPTDYALRIYPLLGGIAALFLYQRFLKVFLKHNLWVPLLFFSVARGLVYYSSEAKQYSTDVLFSIILLYTGYRCFTNRNLRQIITFTLVGIVAFYFSHPSLFIAASVFSGLMLRQVLKKNYADFLKTAALACLSFLNFLLVYFTLLRLNPANPEWEPYFLPFKPGPALLWVPHILNDFVTSPNSLAYTSVSLGVLAIGGLALFRHSKWKAWLILAPFALTLFVSAFKEYPFYDRLLLFLTPSAYILIAEGLQEIRRLGNLIMEEAGTLAFLVISGMLLSLSISQGINNIVAPQAREDIKPILSYLKKNFGANDHIYVYYASVPAWSFYATAYGFTKDQYTEGNDHRSEPDTYSQEISRFKQSKTIWLVFSHNCSWCNVNEESYILSHLPDNRKVSSSLVLDDAALYLLK